MKLVLKGPNDDIKQLDSFVGQNIKFNELDPFPKRVFWSEVWQQVKFRNPII